MSRWGAGLENLKELVQTLCAHSSETQWLEFKQNNDNPEMIGQDISALANSATLHEKSCAYMVWGVEDDTHNIVGTTFDPTTAKRNGQEIENWLRGHLSPNAHFEFHGVEIAGVRVVILIIYGASQHTVMFRKVDYIRVGSYTKKLSDLPALQAQVWNRLRDAKFEKIFAKKDLGADVALNYLDFSVYFELKGIPLPLDMEGILHYMLEEGVLYQGDNGLYNITNMGAILFAKSLTDFSGISRKAIRVVQYQGDNRLNMAREDVGGKGYAVGFGGLIKYVEALLPAQEIIDGALRKTVSAYPAIAIRESIANAIIHQDFSITGTGPLVEIFDSRIEITNPGVPLVDVRRIIDNPPKSRNEKLASLMRNLRMCEELGTGWDKIADSCEKAQLPSPRIDIYEANTKVTLYAKVPFGNLSTDDKLWACYLHACIRQVEGEQVTNSSLRERFGLPDSSAGAISRLIKEAIGLQLIKPVDPTTAPRYMRYLPIWA